GGAFLLLSLAGACAPTQPEDSHVDGGRPRSGTPDGHAMPGLPGLTVNLGTAGNYVILAKTGVSTVPPAVITGNLGVSPAAATYITGFALTADSTNAFSTSAQVTGKVY